MSVASPVERSVGWVLAALVTAGSVVAIVFDLRSGASPATGTGPDTSTTDEQEALAPSSDATKPRSFTLAATGDLLVHESVAVAAATADGWDFTAMFASVEPMLRAADLALCHVESPMSPDNTALSYYPAFNVPNELASAIADAGYDSCSLASNHSIDTGATGVLGTLQALDDVGVAHTGMARDAVEAEKITMLDGNGVRVAHLSYSYGFNSGDLPADAPHLANLIDETRILSDATRARTMGAEVVVVSLHWGTQYTTEPDSLQLDLGPRLLADDSIDLILGHHAHVVQPVATIDSKIIAYGLGNFLSNQSPESCTGCPPATQDGVILELTFTESESGGFIVSSLSHTPTWVDRETYEIVPVLADAGGRDPSLMAESAQRTAEALSMLGTAVDPTSSS